MVRASRAGRRTPPAPSPDCEPTGPRPLLDCCPSNSGRFAGWPVAGGSGCDAVMAWHPQGASSGPPFCCDGWRRPARPFIPPRRSPAQASGRATSLAGPSSKARNSAKRPTTLDQARPARGVVHPLGDTQRRTAAAMADASDQSTSRAVDVPSTQARSVELSVVMPVTPNSNASAMPCCIVAGPLGEAHDGPRHWPQARRTPTAERSLPGSRWRASAPSARRAGDP